LADTINKHDLFHMHFSSDPVAVGSVIEAVLDALAQLCPTADETATIETVLAEVINNIAEHAYQEAPGCPIEIAVRRSEGGADFRFTDRGVAMPGGQLPAGKPQDLHRPVSELPEGGFGWFLIHTLAQDLNYCRSNGENLLCFHLPVGTAAGTQ